MRVAVIGGGAMGAATSWRLARRGVDVVCYDRYSPPHPLGSTHGDTRIIRTAYLEGPWYVPLLQEAFPLWRELEAVSRAHLLRKTLALMRGVTSSGGRPRANHVPAAPGTRDRDLRGAGARQQFSRPHACDEGH